MNLINWYIIILSYSHNPYREKKDSARVISPTEKFPLAFCNHSVLRVVKTEWKKLNLLLSLFSLLVKILKSCKIAAIWIKRVQHDNKSQHWPTWTLLSLLLIKVLIKLYWIHKKNYVTSILLINPSKIQLFFIAKLIVILNYKA